MLILCTSSKYFGIIYVRVIIMENKTVERDIVLNAYYVINYFNEKKVEVSHLKLQKLMYFLEAIYMTINDTDELFDSEFYAWNYGPVSRQLYDRFKKYGSFSISLLPEEIKLSQKCNYIKEYVDILFNLFGTMSSADLVTLTHVNGSPWFKIAQCNNINEINKSIVINKKDTKDWFKKIVRLDGK